jgi:hypothetical protein
MFVLYLYIKLASSFSGSLLTAGKGIVDVNIALSPCYFSLQNIRTLHLRMLVSLLPDRLSCPQYRSYSWYKVKNYKDQVTSGRVMFIPSFKKMHQ